MIVGGKVTKVSAERLADGNFEGLAVNVNINSMQRRGKMLVISYTHSIDYKEKVAIMKIDGELLVEDSEANLKKTEEDWKRTGDVPKELAEAVLNAVNHAGTAVGTLLSFAINIQAPVISSRISIGDKKPKTAG